MSQNTTQTSRAMSLDLEKQPSSLSGTGPTNSSSADPIRPRRTTKQALPLQTNTKIMIVWLESLEDHIQFPIGSSTFLLILFKYRVFHIYSFNLKRLSDKSNFLKNRSSMVGL